ncbi:cytochrome P450 [Sorangium sp. So ce216]
MRQKSYSHPAPAASRRQSHFAREGGVLQTFPPGPSLPSAVQGYRYNADPMGFIEECAARYGDCFTLRFPLQPAAVYVKSPEVVKQIFAGSADDLRMGEAAAPIDFLLGSNSLIRLDGARHTRDRKLLMPSFHGERIVAYAEMMRVIAERAVDGWELGKPFSFLKAAQNITLSIMLECIFGVEPGELHDRLRVLLPKFLHESSKPMISLLWATVPGKLLRDVLVRGLAPAVHALGPAGSVVPAGTWARSLREIDEFLYSHIAALRARRSPEARDIISMLIEVRDEDGNAFSDAELRDEMMTMLVAGHETTAITLTWAMAKILEYPHVLAAIREELDQVIGDRPPSGAAIGELRYLEATIKEVLRLYPPSPGIARKLHVPGRFGGYDLPAGVVLYPSIYLLHRRPDIWPDPLRFDPSRFLDKKPNPTAYIPFGGGLRTCLGMSFALFELKLVLATILSRASLRAVEAPPLRYVPRGILLPFGPSHEVPVALEAREPKRPRRSAQASILSN